MILKKTVFQWNSDSASWYFVTISVSEVEEMLGHKVPKRSGWGQIRVTITIGKTTWESCLFPSKETGYALPIKKSVRKTEGIDDGTLVTMEIIHS